MRIHDERADRQGCNPERFDGSRERQADHQKAHSYDRQHRARGKGKLIFLFYKKTLLRRISARFCLRFRGVFSFSSIETYPKICPGRLSRSFIGKCLSNSSASFASIKYPSGSLKLPPPQFFTSSRKLGTSSFIRK